MNPPFRLLLLVLALEVVCGHRVAGQDLADRLRKAELAAQQSDQSAFRLMATVMHEARASRQTGIFLQAANSIARLGLNRKVHYDSAFALTRDAAKAVAYSESDTSLASIYYNLARFYKNEFEAGEAIKWFTQAAAIFDKSPGAGRAVANCYHGLADVYKYTVFNFQLAEEYYERALSIREVHQLKDTIALFNNYYGLAATNRSQHDYEKAVAYGTVAITLAASLPSTRLNIIRQEFAQSMIGNIYRDMGLTAEAIRSYTEALRLNEVTGNKGARASHYQNLGETMRDDSLYAEALQYYRQAEQLYLSMKDRDERLFQNMLISKAMTYVELRDHKNFEKIVAEIFAELKRTGRGRSQEAAETYLMIADHYARDQKYYSAVDQCQLALVAAIPNFNTMEPKNNPTITMIGTSFYTGEILARKGEYLSRLYRATKQHNYLDQALKCLYLAEQLLSEERNRLDTEDAKWAFLDTKYTVYESIIASLYEARNDVRDGTILEQAYQYFERSKARSLSDALAAAEQARLIGADDSLLQARGRLKAEQFTIENKISDLNVQGNRLVEVARLREQLVTLDRQLQLYSEAIEKRYPGYFNAMYGQGLNPLPDVQKLAQKENRVVVEYFWGSEWVYGLGIAPDTVVFERVGASAEIEGAINSLLVHLHDEHSSASPEVFQSFVRSSHALYQRLVGPFAPILGPASLQVIPDGAINLVPFDILIEKLPLKPSVDYRGLDYLLKARPIGYAYSTAMISGDGRTVRRPSVLAVGFTGGQRERAEVDMEALQEIDGAEKELETLSARFKGGRFLRDSEATESNFKMLSPAYDIIHLAIHGRGDRSSNFSASLFFRSAPDTLDDGIFHAYELYGLKLKALMAVLSACESGIGRDYRGEGMISMASAFTSAGCENTLMSLWKVNDQASIELMDDFYLQLLDGAPIDEALRTAKLNYLARADELTADPKTWAPLVAYGSLHQVFDTGNRRSYLILVLAAGVLLVGGGVYYFRRRRWA